MKTDSIKYSIPDKRELSNCERMLLKVLATDSVEIAAHVDKLIVVARCGCGTCPTILFGNSLDDVPIASNKSERSKEWMGRLITGQMVAIQLHVSDGIPVELEAWSPEGADIVDWPELDSIKVSDLKSDR